MAQEEIDPDPLISPQEEENNPDGSSSITTSQTIFTIYELLLNIIPFYHCEDAIEPNHDLNSEKYIKNQFYIEKYFKFKNILNAPSDLWPPELVLSYQQVRNSINVLERIYGTIESGVRLIFLPDINLNTTQVSLLRNDKKVQGLKINYIRGKTSTDSTVKNYFPLLVCEYSELITVSKIKEIINDIQEIDKLFVSLRKNIISNLTFQKMFQYIFPVSVFELLLLIDLKKQQALLDKVYKENKVYSSENSNSDFRLSLIKMIEYLVEPENANKL